MKEYDDDEQGKSANGRKQERIKRNHKQTTSRREKVKERNEVRNRGSEEEESDIMADDHNKDGSIDLTSNSGAALGIEEGREEMLQSKKGEGDDRGEGSGEKGGRGECRGKEKSIGGKKAVGIHDSPTPPARPRLWRPG